MKPYAYFAPPYIDAQGVAHSFGWHRRWGWLHVSSGSKAVHRMPRYRLGWSLIAARRN